MKYDPIKARLGRVFNRHILLRKIFYQLLDLLLLRSWHVHHHLKSFFRHTSKRNDIRVLDAGSGFGQYSWYLAKKRPSWTIHGIELKEEQVQDCNNFFRKASKNDAGFFTGDLTTYQRENYYDLILSIDVMEHIEEDVKVFKNFYASMRSDGLLLISTPSDQGGSGVEHEHDSSFIEEHVRDGYGKDEIKKKLQSAGFQDIRVHYTYGKPGSLSWKLSMKYPILMLGRSAIFYILLPLYYLLVFPFCMILNYIDVRQHHKSGTGLLVKAYKRKP
ncbi:MAG: class I SAM-dependent methyltransferase [Bacteroidota bacterium]